jgi:proline-specific peptidase
VGEGHVQFRGFQTWYRDVGETEEGRLPVLLLHGGPGATCDYLEPLLGLAETDRRTVTYDQIGAGRSKVPPRALDWTVDLFVEEVGAVREALGLDHVHLFGHSWGGMLAMQYALTQPSGLASLVVGHSPASIPQWIEETAKLRAELPDDVQATLTRHERAGTVDDPEYEAACMVFYRRHVCRADEWPEYVLRSFAEIGEVYNTMNGPSEFHVVGTIKDWTVVDRLGEIRVPTLVITGEHDEATPAINQTVTNGIPGARSVILPGRSHIAHAEAPAEYLALLDDFFSSVEAL